MLLLPVPARPNHSLHCALVAEETCREDEEDDREETEEESGEGRSTGG